MAAADLEAVKVIDDNVSDDIHVKARSMENLLLDMRVAAFLKHC